MVSNTVTLTTAIVGAVCGIAGAVLGVINTLHQLQRNKLRLKVIPQHVILVGAIANAHINFSIEVTNMSEFPVVIADVGFLLSDGCTATLATVGVEPKGQLPLRLDSRTQYTKCFWLDNAEFDLTAIKCAYTRTECGNTVRGTSPALKQLIQKASNDGR